ncbi:MAG: HDOD domain-containing protein [Azonexus sp.]|nr:HDOD domain-containing protein [Azonexus sp.]MCK6413204.1 HDOD domain-containing protein [Azonexus sp.]
MTAPSYLFIHPLLAADEACAGYRCDFAPTADPTPAMAQLLADPCWRKFPAQTLWLAPALPLYANEERLTAEFAAVPTDDAGSELLARLQAAGHKTALTLQPGQTLPTSGGWDYFFLRCSHARSLPPLALLGLSAHGKLIAGEVYNHTDHDWIRKNGFTLCSDEYLLTRNPGASRADTTRTRLLRLLALIAEDAGTAELEAVFRQEPKLSYSLLRLVNSAAVAPRTRITSFGQAINLLGRRQLQRWVQLLVYADPDNGQGPNPLLLKAAARGHLMETLSLGLTLPAELEEPQDAAFMIGSFSLLDVLLNRPLPEILAQLPLVDAVRQALIGNDGQLGQLLAAIQHAENGDLSLAEVTLAQCGIPPAEHLHAQLATLYWTGGIQLAA